MIAGCNAVGEDTIKAAHNLGIRTHVHEKNINKYPMMRELLEQATGEWVLWLDDDTFSTSPNWLQGLINVIDAEPYTMGVGKPYTFDLLPGQWDWVREASWYNGLGPMINDKGVPYTKFMTGGLFLIRRPVLGALNWPDPRIDHNGGDVMLGEAMRQHGFTFSRLPDDVPVVVSGAERRGTSQKPAGAVGLAPRPLPEDKRLSSDPLILPPSITAEMVRTGYMEELCPDVVRLKNAREKLEAALDNTRVSNLYKPGCSSCNRGKAYNKLRVAVLNAHRVTANIIDRALKTGNDRVKDSLTARFGNTLDKVEYGGPTK
jgi:hypothetical protein